MENDGLTYLKEVAKYFMDFLETRAKYYGDLIGAKYGEPFFSIKPIGITDIFDLLISKG